MTPNLLTLVGTWAKESGYTLSGQPQLKDGYLNIAVSSKHEYLTIYANGHVCCSDIQRRDGRDAPRYLKWINLKPADPEFFVELQALVLAEPLW